MGYGHEMVPEFKDCDERLNSDSKLPNFDTRRILVPCSQALNESLKPTKGLSDPESSKDSKVESITPLPPLKIFRELHQAQSISGTITVSETEPTTPSVLLGLVPEPFSLSIDLNIKSPKLLKLKYVCSGTKTEEGPWLELQFSLVDNSKLNVVYLLNRS
ncbi:hypothetical protein Tco_1498518 [Tanacetum coccineum]